MLPFMLSIQILGWDSLPKKVSQDTPNYLKNTSDSKSYNAITSIKFEVCQSGNILQEIQVPIYYKDHLSS